MGTAACSSRGFGLAGAGVPEVGLGVSLDGGTGVSVGVSDGGCAGGVSLDGGVGVSVGVGVCAGVSVGDGVTVSDWVGEVLVGSSCANAAADVPPNASTAAVASAPTLSRARLTDLSDNGSPKDP